jgi:hypothetical protein
MTPRTRITTILLASVLPLAGCFGSSDDKGDNGDPTIITPKPSSVQDANTAGELKTILPEKPESPEVQTTPPKDAAPK